MELRYQEGYNFWYWLKEVLGSVEWWLPFDRFNRAWWQYPSHVLTTMGRGSRNPVQVVVNACATLADHHALE
jgi:hypothetical protein